MQDDAVSDDAVSDDAVSDEEDGAPDDENTAETDPPEVPEPGPCPDLDQDEVWDCEQTLLRNPGFDEGIDSWGEDPDVEGSWQTNDGEGRTTSGSVVVRNEYTVDSDASGFGGVHQCLEVEAGQQYQIAAQVWTPAHQGDATAGMQIQFYGEADCLGFPFASTVALTSATEEWHTVGAIFTAPVGSLTMRVGLGSVKPFRLQEFSAFIDNALIRKQQ